MNRTTPCLIVASLFLLFQIPSFAQEPREHPLIPAINLAKQSLNVLNQVKDYEAIFTKRELVNGKLISQRMLLKLREKPFSVYMKFLEPNAGREILFVQGRNNNQLRAHEPGALQSLVGTISLSLNSPTVMAENRHQITDVGMRRLLEQLLAQWNIESKYGEIDVQFYPNAMMGEVPCEVIETTHPQPRKQFNFHLTRLFIDKKSRLPIRIENYGWPRPGQRPPIIEEYTYTNIRLNVGLTDQDFSEQNKAYNF